MAAKFTVTLNEIHKPSVSFVEIEDADAFLAETTLNGKLYLTKTFLRNEGWTPGDNLEVTIKKV